MGNERRKVYEMEAVSREGREDRLCVGDGMILVMQGRDEKQA